MTTDVPPATSPADAVLANVVAQIELRTRFDRDRLAWVAATIEKVPTHAQQRFIVGFNIQTQNGHGLLPFDADSVGDDSGLQAHMERLTAHVRSVLPHRLGQWETTYDNVPGPKLTAADCFEAPRPAGFKWTCRTCDGTKKVTCSRCSGEGKLTCGTCNGLKTVSCHTCNGSGKLWWGTNRTVYDLNTKSYRTEYFKDWYWCPSCGGSRSQGCQTCNARGLVNCGTCGATGQVLCSACGATGSRHKVATVRCDIAQTFVVHADTALDEARHVLEALDLYALCELGPFVRVPGAIGNDTLEHSFTGEVSVTRLGFNMAGARHEIIGYGVAGQVKDYKNIVGVLLQEDLSALEANLAATSTFPLRPVHTLEASLQKFMSSDINMRIGTLADQPHTQLESVARDEFKQAVSIDYVVDAAAAIRQGLVRIYRSFALPGLVVTAALPAMLIGAAYLLGLTRMYPWWSLLGSIGIAFGMGWFLERRARLHMKACFDTIVGGRAFEIAAPLNSVRNWRRVARVLGVVGALYVWFKI